MKTKTIALLLAVALVFGGVIGGTIAWLTDITAPVTNTFTTGDVNITLKESPLNSDGTYGEAAENVTNAYQLIPGTTYTKDPTVTVLANSEDCYLFVKFEETGNPSTYLTYKSTLTTEKGWTQGDGTEIPSDVWYREVTASDKDQSWELLDGNTITVAKTVTKENMTAAANAKLVYTAYACQKDNLTAAQAWKEVNP